MLCMIHICVCVYIYIYIHTHVYIYIYTHTYTYSTVILWYSIWDWAPSSSFSPAAAGLSSKLQICVF